MDDPQTFQPWLPGQPPPWLGPVAPDGTPLDTPAAAVDAAVAPTTTPAPDPTAAAPALPPQLPGVPALSTALGGPAPAPAQDAPVTSPSQVDAQPVSTSALFDPQLAMYGVPSIPVAPHVMTPDEQATATASDRSLPLDQRAKALDDSTLTPEQRAQVLAKMSPEDLSALNIAEQQRKIHEQSAQMLEASRVNAEQQAQHYQDYQAAVAKASADSAAVQADAQRLANTHIDPQIHGVGNAILALVTATIGGAASQATGGRNLALEQLNKQIEAHIQAQKDNIANGWQGVNTRRNAIAQELQTHGDLYRAQEAFRVATYDRALSDIQTKMQDFDPAGTTALRMADSAQQIAAQRAAAIQAYTDKKLKDNLDIAKSVREDQQAAEAARHNKAQEGLEWSKFGLEKTKTDAENQVFTPEQFGQLGYQAVPPVPMSQKQYGTWLEAKTKNADLAGKQVANADAENKGTNSAPVQIATADDGTPVVKTQQMVQADGKTPWHAPEKFGEVLAGAANVNRLSDNLTREINEWGGQSDIVKSPHWQQIKSDYQSLVFALHKAEGVEGFRPGTSEMLHELTGGVDPTSFMRNASAGIQRAKQNINEDVNQYAVSKNYTGAPITFPDMARPKAPNKTKIDQLGEALVSKPSNDVPADAEWTWRASHKSLVDEGQAARLFGDMTPEMKQALDVGMPPSKLEALSKLSDALTSPLLKSTDEKVAKKAQAEALAARKALEKAAQDSPFPYISDAANRLLLPDPSQGLNPDGSSVPQEPLQ